MADTGFLTPTTTPTPGLFNDWTNPTNAFTENGVFAQVADTQDRKQDYGTFGFSIPAGSAIDGIEVLIKGKMSSDTYTFPVAIKRVGKSSGSGSSTSTGNPLFTTTNTQYTVGSATDLWGLTDLVAEDFDDLVFYIGISGKASSTITSYVDGIQVKVYYSEAYAPTVTTQAVTNISSATATGNGNVTDAGNPTLTERGVAWNTAGTPTTADSTATSTGTTGAYAPAITGLAGGTTYYVRAYATNSEGTSYGSEVSFTTSGLTNPNNAFATDNVYATTLAGTGDISIQLSGDAGATYSSSLTKTFTGSEGAQTYGTGATELWGLSWTGAEVDDTSFRLKVSAGSTTQVYKTFGFAPSASVILTGIEVSVEAKWDGTTTSIDHIRAKIYFGTSTTPVQAGAIAYASDGNSGDGALVLYDETDNWVELGTGGGSFQPLDSDLTTIASLTPTTDNFMVATASAWASRTPSQARTQMGLGTLATNSSVTNAMLSTSAGEIGAAWTAWTPTLSGRFDDADWTKDCAFIQIGETVFWRLKLTATAAAPMGGGATDAIFTLPVTAHAGHLGTDQTGWIGGGGIYDVGVSAIACGVYASGGDGTTARIRIWSADTTNVNLRVITSTSPFNWTTGDEITGSGSYQAA